MNLTSFRNPQPTTAPSNGHHRSPPTGLAAAARPVAVNGPRRRRPALAAAGIALAALGGLGAAAAVTHAQARRAVLALARPVPFGATLTIADLTVVHLPATAGLTPLPAAAETSVLGRTAAIGLAAGSLLVPADVSGAAVPGPGQQLVGLTLSPGQLPARPLVPGQPVLLILVAGPGSDAASIPAAVTGQLVDEGPPTSSGTTPADVVVSAGVGPQLAAAAAAGHVAMIAAPAGGG